MMKLVFAACLCTCLLIDAQGAPGGGPPGGGPPGGGPPDGMPPGGGPPGKLSGVVNRVVRQAPPPNGPIPQGMSGGGGPGNLGMQGLGNIPDPTVWIAKGQEVMSQMARGRRRRELNNWEMDAANA